MITNIYLHFHNKMEKGCYLFDIMLQECVDNRIISEITIGTIITRTMETGEINYRYSFTNAFFNLFELEKEELIKRWCSYAQEETKGLNEFFSTNF